MTTQGLLLLILLIIFVQLVVYAGVAFFRYWLSYQALKAQVGMAVGEAMPEPAGGSTASPAPAWEGWRKFKVSRRAYEDAAGTVCSFYLAPVDGKQIVRCYSLSSNHFHDRVREGDVLAVKAPSGHFHLDVDSDGPVVLVAGGIGITPDVQSGA